MKEGQETAKGQMKKGGKVRPEIYDVGLEKTIKTIELLEIIQSKIEKAYQTGRNEGFDCGLRKSFQQSQDGLVSLVTDALTELGHRICPHCERGIGMEDYLTVEDIEKWLKERK